MGWILLLLFNSSTQGVISWSGPSAIRTAVIEPEVRIIVISPS